MTRHRLPAAAVLAAALVFTAGPAAREDTAGCSDRRFRAAVDTARATLAEQRLPSAAVAVAIRGRVLCEAAFGFADVERGIPATPSTMYSLASISKPFTATAIMAFVERGTLRLDRSANEYLGEARLRAFEGKAEDATVQRLLTHTAGLPLHYQFFYAGGPRAPAMDAAIARYGIIVYPPGERYVYSNFGFGVLERILERAAGQPFDAALRTTVLEPLRLRETMVSDGAGLDGTRAAVRYGPGHAAVPPYTFEHVGASGVWSSARDLVRFGIFHLGHDARGASPPLSRGTRRRMQQDHAASDTPGRTRGLGWGIADLPEGWRQVAHTGSMPGVATILSLYPEQDAAVVVLTNTSNSPAVARIEKAFASAVLPAPRTAGGRAPQPGGAQAPPPPAGSRDLGEVAGRWLGQVHVAGAARRVALDIRADGEARIRVGEEDAEDAALEGARMNGAWLTARTAARIAPADAAPPDQAAAHRTTLTLALRGSRLSGWATSLSTANPTYGAVSFALELRKTNPSSPVPEPSGDESFKPRIGEYNRWTRRSPAPSINPSIGGSSSWQSDSPIGFGDSRMRGRKDSQDSRDQGSGMGDWATATDAGRSTSSPIR